MKGIRPPSIKITISAVVGLAVSIAVINLACLSINHYENSVVLQSQQQMLMSARSIAGGIESFIVEHSNDLKTISKNLKIQEKIFNGFILKETFNEHCICWDLYEAHKDHVDALTILDDKGIVLRRLPFLEATNGSDQSDKPGVDYVLKYHERHVSDIFYNNMGKLAIYVFEPVFYKKKFAGIIRWMIQIDRLSKLFIEKVSLSEKSYIWMFDNKEIILSHPRKEYIGMTVLDVIRKIHNERGDIFDEISLKEHICEEHDYLNRVKVEEEGYGVGVNCVTDEKELVVYKILSIGDRNWNLIITIPYSEITEPIFDHVRNTIGLSAIVILMFGFGGIVLFRTQKVKAELETKTKYLKQISLGAEELKESELRFHRLADLLPQPVFEIDLDGNVTYSNRRGFETFGYSNEDFEKGVNALELFIEKERQRVRQNINKRFAGEEFEDHEYIGLKKDGSIFPILVYSAPIVAHNKPVGLRGIVIDITDRKQAAEEQGQRERLQGVIEMAGAVCHELSQPMQVISIYSQMLMSDMRSDNSLHENIKKIKTQIDRMERIKNNLMRITRYESKDYLFDGEKIIDIDKASANDYKPSQKYI